MGTARSKTDWGERSQRAPRSSWRNGCSRVSVHDPNLRTRSRLPADGCIHGTYRVLRAESDRRLESPVAQWIARPPPKGQVTGSNPVRGTNRRFRRVSRSTVRSLTAANLQRIESTGLVSKKACGANASALDATYIARVAVGGESRTWNGSPCLPWRCSRSSLHPSRDRCPLRFRFTANPISH